MSVFYYLVWSTTFAVIAIVSYVLGNLCAGSAIEVYKNVGIITKKIKFFGDKYFYNVAVLNEKDKLIIVRTLLYNTTRGTYDVGTGVDITFKKYRLFYDDAELVGEDDGLDKSYVRYTKYFELFIVNAYLIFIFLYALLSILFLATTNFNFV